MEQQNLITGPARSRGKLASVAEIAGQGSLFDPADGLIVATPRPIVEGHVSTRRANQIVAAENARLARLEDRQVLLYNTPHFVACPFPIDRLEPNEDGTPVLEYGRENGDYRLSIVGHPTYGVPYGKDRAIVLMLATLAVQQKRDGRVPRRIEFTSGAQMLNFWGMSSPGGREYRRQEDGFYRVFYSNIYLSGRQRSARGSRSAGAAFRFLRAFDLWFGASGQGGRTEVMDPNDRRVNWIELSEENADQLSASVVPFDRETIQALQGSPLALDFYCWLTWRCARAARRTAIPLFGPGGLVQQLGMAGYSRKSNAKLTIQRMLTMISAYWKPSAAVEGDSLVIWKGFAVSPRLITGPGPGI